MAPTPLDITMLFEDTPDYLAGLIVDEAAIIRASHALMLAVVFITTIAAFAFLGPVLDMLFVVDSDPGAVEAQASATDTVYKDYAPDLVDKGNAPDTTGKDSAPDP
ncbi:hypothetical protein Q8F55_005705 [Vanrija albida]|uniref:Uncharacterized protein n=1 Tax=Vanrija albida TaxID=181172 RepID=A0ABR3Q2K9_9TREE